MRINLYMSGVARSGYLNISPFATQSVDNPQVIRGSVSNLDEFAEDSEADEILALSVVDFLPARNVEESITHWVSKLRHGGSITISGLDINLACKAVARQEIDLATANQLIYGNQSATWDHRKASLNILAVVDMLKTKGLKITSKRFDNYDYIVKAERP